MIANKTVNAGTKIASMILDHFIMTFLCSLFIFPLITKQFLEAFNATHAPFWIELDGPLWYLALMGFALYLCKDIVQGRSLGKRITNTQVVDRATKKAASPLQCVVRNITTLFWMIEAIITLFNPSRRLGDLIAGTEVVPYEFSPSEKSTTSLFQVCIAFALAYGIIILLTLPFKVLYETTKKVLYDSTSYSELESKALEMKFLESFGEYLDTEVKIYEYGENDTLKHITISFILKNTDVNDDDHLLLVQDVTKEFLYMHYPQHSFKGTAQYVMKTPKNKKSVTSQIGLDASNRVTTFTFTR
jgi:uncharacterized RDD family membrane protein YckC